MKSCIAIALASLIAILPANAIARTDTARVTEPAAGTQAKAYRNSPLITAFDTVGEKTRDAGRMISQGFTRKLFHVSRETKLDAGTPVFFDTGDWWCTGRDNYYAGGGRFGKLCLRDQDGDGAFERVRMNRGLLMRTLDPPVPHSEYQARSETRPTGLRKALIYRGRSAKALSIEYVEYVKSASDPAVSRMITVPFVGDAGWFTAEGVTFKVVAARETSLDYSIVSGTL